MFDVEAICRSAKEAGNRFTSVSEEKKNSLLLAIKSVIWENKEAIMNVNRQDIDNARENGLAESLIDRLTLTESRIMTMCCGIEDVIGLPDYVGLVEDSYVLANGLKVDKVHVPLGVVGIIYESRPNVTVDAAILCIKSGNAVILKGGKEAICTNRFLVDLMKKAFRECQCDDALVGFIDGTERELTAQMLSMDKYIDVVIPRGGEKLKKYVLSAATMPVIASSGGNCHVYVEKSADLKMAMKIIENAKLSRPSVCNACETLLVDRAIASVFLPECLEFLASKGVEIRGKKEILPYYEQTKIVDDDEFYKEYIDKIIKVKTLENYFGTRRAMFFEGSGVISPFRNDVWVISKTCKNLDAALKLMDYLYSEEGARLCSYGIEGENYTVAEDGSITFDQEKIDWYLKNANDPYREYCNEIGVGCLAFAGRFYDDAWYEFMDQDSRDMYAFWLADENITPYSYNLCLSAEDTAAVADLMNACSTLVSTESLKFIMGTRSLDEFDSFVAELKNLGAETIEEVYNKAYEASLSK